MAATLPKRFEPFVVPGGLKGQISELPVPDILQHLRLSQATGILTLVAGGARKALYLKDGRVVFASSNLPNDRLGEILLREGKITVEEYEASIKAITKGKRQGKVLVEMGALSPKDLWEGVQFQVKEIVYTVFQWDEGQFHFEESTLPEKERITVDLDIQDLILAGLRRVDAGGRLQSRYPETDVVLERATSRVPSPLEPYEVHVLKLVDGERSVLDICRESEIGDNETLKVLYALVTTGVARVKGRRSSPSTRTSCPSTPSTPCSTPSTRCTPTSSSTWSARSAPSPRTCSRSTWAPCATAARTSSAGVKLQKDGTLDVAVIERNLSKFPEEQRRSLLVDGLNELLYAELLAIKRTLGAEHEAAIVKALKH